MGQEARLAVILVNWRSAADTIECLETLLRSSIPVQVIVCDNDSADGSAEMIAAWASGGTRVQLKNSRLARLSDGALERPVAFDHLQPGQTLEDGPRKRLTIIETGGNLGYAGGNNVGLRAALQNPAVTHFWLLNNDTVVERDTAARILACFETRPELGMVGTDLRLYGDPERLQMQGGLSFDKWTGRARGIGAGRSIFDPLPADRVEQEADFICGASMTVSRRFLDEVGLLEERYFLYYEEIDWAVRGRGRFRLGYCPDAVVYHKEGASAGSSSGSERRSELSEYHHTRSRLIFGKLHYPALLPLYFAYGMALALRRSLSGNRTKAIAILRASFGLPFIKR